MNCPNDETLSAYLDGEIAQAERTEIAVHITSCRDCLVRYEALRASDKALLCGFEAMRACAPAAAISAGSRNSRLLSRPVGFGVAAAVLLVAVCALLYSVGVRETTTPAAGVKTTGTVPEWAEDPSDLPSAVIAALALPAEPPAEVLWEGELVPRTWHDVVRRKHTLRRLAADEMPSWKADYYLQRYGMLCAAGGGTTR